MPLGKPLIEFEELPSTNSYLLDDISLCAQHGLTVWTHKQTNGRGRAGRTFVSPSNQVLTFSVVIHSSDPEDRLHLWALWSGLALFRSLSEKGLSNLSLKWPNDLLIKKKKISGILIETIDLNNHVGVIIGIGINVHMSDEEGKEIDQSWISLDEVTDSINDRNEIIGDIVNKIFQLTSLFTSEGFKPYKLDYESLDLVTGKKCKINIEGIDKTVDVLGVNDKGEMLVKEGSEYLTLRYGEVSIREL